MSSRNLKWIHYKGNWNVIIVTNCSRWVHQCTDFQKNPQMKQCVFLFRILCTLRYLFLKSLKEMIASKIAFFQVLKFQSEMHLWLLSFWKVFRILLSLTLLSLPWRSGHTWWRWCRRRCWRRTWCGCAEKEFFFCYATNYGVYFYSFSKEPGNVKLCSPVRILCTLDCIGCINAFNFPKS